MNILTIDGDLKLALEWAIELALDDQEHYLQNANPEVDYGAEWPDTAAMKAGMLNGLATVCRQMGDDGLAGRCTALADSVLGTVEEPDADELDYYNLGVMAASVSRARNNGRRKPLTTPAYAYRIVAPMMHGSYPAKWSDVGKDHRAAFEAGYLLEVTDAK